MVIQSEQADINKASGKLINVPSRLNNAGTVSYFLGAVRTRAGINGREQSIRTRMRIEIADGRPNTQRICGQCAILFVMTLGEFKSRATSPRCE